MSEETQSEIRSWLHGRGYSKSQTADFEGMLQCMWQELDEILKIVAL